MSEYNHLKKRIYNETFGHQPFLPVVHTSRVHQPFWSHLSAWKCTQSKQGCGWRCHRGWRTVACPHSTGKSFSKAAPPALAEWSPCIKIAYTLEKFCPGPLLLPSQQWEDTGASVLFCRQTWWNRQHIVSAVCFNLSEWLSYSSACSEPHTISGIICKSLSNFFCTHPKNPLHCFNSLLHSTLNSKKVLSCFMSL